LIVTTSTTTSVSGGSSNNKSHIDKKIKNNCKKYEKTSEKENMSGFLCYTYEMLTKKNELRRIQMKLTLFSINRCLDYLNDFIFLLKLFYELFINKYNYSNNINNNNRKYEYINKVIFVWLLFLYITSFFTFYFRKNFIIHLIPLKYNDMFSFNKVFYTIKNIDQEDIKVLYFYKKFYKTYLLVNKIYEDIPQFCLSLLYILLNGKDIFLMLIMLCYLFYFTVNIIYFGKKSSIFKTVRLLFQANFVQELLIQLGASPLNEFFFLYSATVFFVWSFLALSTAKLVSAFLFPLFSTITISNYIFFIFFTFLFYDKKENVRNNTLLYLQ
ncbi:conserved protein, unknown function, partial [Hepatocystis sp. ex Piliocolobus tephrosceles]